MNFKELVAKAKSSGAVSLKISYRKKQEVCGYFKEW